VSDTHDPVTLDVLEANIHLLAERSAWSTDKRRLQEIDRLKTEFLAGSATTCARPLTASSAFPTC